MIADRDDVVLHAGWDIPNYRWYELEGLRVGTTTSGNDLLIERECSQVTLAAAAVSMRGWREFRSRAPPAAGTTRGGRCRRRWSTPALRTLWTPCARFDQRSPIDL